MAQWNITVPAGSGVGGGSSGSNTSDVSGSRPSDFDGATINSVTLSGAGNVTLNANTSNDTIGIRWNIETSGGANTYGSVGSDAASIAYCPVTAFNVLPAAIAAGGSPSPAPTTAVAADWHQVAWDWTYSAAGKNDNSTCDWSSFTIVVDYTANADVTADGNNASLPLLTAAGETATTATGSPSLPLLTASGTSRTIKTADGSPSLPLLTTTGSEFLWPRVYLNTTETKSGATELPVTAANAAGTSVTFDDPVGAPTGSLKLGVENQSNDAIGWIDVTVSAGAADVTGTGSPNLPLLTASGTSRTIKTASGSPSLPLLTASGVSEVIKTAVGAAVLPLIAAAGVTAHVAEGAPSLPLLTASGTSAIVKTATGSPSLPLLTASGQSAVIKTADGSPNLPLLTAAGTSVQTRSANGSPNLPLMTASGTGAVSGTISANGSPNLPLITAAGTSTLSRSATGAPSLPLLTAAGVSEVIHTASGSPALPLLTASGVTAYTATGSPELPLITAAGTAEVEKTASGSPNLPLITASGVSEVIKTATGAPNLPLLTASGDANVGGAISATGSPNLPLLTASGRTAYTATGSPSIPLLTASGSAVREIAGTGAVTLPLLTASGTGTVSGGADITGTGSPSLPLLTASGSGFLWPRAYLNTSQTLTSAEEMTVVAANADGTSITFHDPIESPGISGSVFLGIENRNNSGVGWLAVTVTATTADVRGEGAVTLPLLTASGTEATSFLPPDVYVTGGAANIDLPEVTTSGDSTARPISGTGSPELPLLTTSGATVASRSATGSPELPLLTADGGTFPPFANGAADLPLLEARGNAISGGEIPIRDTHYSTVLIKRYVFESVRFPPNEIYSQVQIQDDHFATAAIGGDSYAIVRMTND